MNRLRWQARLYIAAVAVTALGLLLALLLWRLEPTVGQIPPILVLGGGMVLAWLYPLPFTFKTRLYLDLGVIVAMILLLDPGIAAITATSGTLLAHLIRRQPWDETVLNSAQVTIQVVAGSLIMAAVSWNPAHPVFESLLPVVMVAIAGTIMHLISDLSIAVIVGIQADLPLRQVWWQGVRSTDPVEYLAQAGQVGLGLLAALLVSIHLTALLLVALLGAVIYVPLAHNIRLRRQLEDALQDREASLAEAQGIAQLGSWTWNLANGEQYWSDETYRIFGFTAQAIAPTYEVFLECVHPEDRAMVDREVHEALYAGGTFSIDHRIRRPDGTERVVHEQGRIIRDSAGRKARIVGTIHDITERKALETQLAHQAYHDSLTGLTNRARFIEELSRELASRDRHQRGFTVLFLDLDRFKLVNDTFGHETGDHLLIEVAERLRRCIRAGDIAARFGGDEFTIFMEGRSLPEAERVATRIITAISAPMVIGSHEVVITPSIGIVLSDARHRSASDVIREADAALYRAKNQGRARFVVDESLVTPVCESASIVAD